MAHEDAGQYAAKYPDGTQMNPEIAERVRDRARDDRIGCAAAHAIAEELKCSPADVGMTIDLLEIRINQCQLGLFGHSPQKRIVKPAEHVSPEVQNAIKQVAQDERDISCINIWKIAEECDMTRLDAACACETLKIKISSCQLGAF